MPRSTKVLLPLFIVLMTGAILSSAIAAAYSGLEGIWTGTAKAIGSDVGKGTGAAACKEGTLEVQVDSGRRMRGAIHIDGTYYLVQGKVEEDGSMTGYVGDDPIFTAYLRSESNPAEWAHTNLWLVPGLLYGPY